MMRALLACVYWAWWRFVLAVAKPSQPAYLHAQWRIWQEMSIIRAFIEGGLR